MDSHAVIIGAGVSGLLTAAALARHFEEVTLLERDVLPSGPEARRGTPQDQHFHALLAGGFEIMNRLLPDFGQELEAGGAVKLHASLDMRVERPGYDPFPQRDLGLFNYSQSRPLLEHCLRQRVRALPAVRVLEDARAQRLETHPSGRVTGVVLDGGRSISADLVVDASGAGTHTLALLEAQRQPLPEEDVVEVNVHYATGIFEIPDDRPDDWKTLMTVPRIPESSRGLLISPLEGGRWICGLSGRGDERPPGDHLGFLEFCRQARTQTAYQALRAAKLLQPIIRAGFKHSRRRHFHRLGSFPDGLLPIGDVLCKLNPVYGQGMSVAALQVSRLDALLSTMSGRERSQFNALRSGFFSTMAESLQAPWETSVYPDYLFATTQGPRPADLARRIAFSRALVAVAAENAEAHKLFTEVNYMLKPLAALTELPIHREVMSRLG
jgi:2-polyprenyl-6-methoxyphenol hydroxylase-like FAD-dependent oxidoreductase